MAPEIVRPLARRVGLLCRTIEEDAIARDEAGYLIVTRHVGEDAWRPWDGERTARFTADAGAAADYAWRLVVGQAGPYGGWRYEPARELYERLQAMRWSAEWEATDARPVAQSTPARKRKREAGGPARR
jgi:hypothetical protein